MYYLTNKNFGKKSRNHQGHKFFLSFFSTTLNVLALRVMRSLRYRKEWGKKKPMFKAEMKGDREDKQLIISYLSLLSGK